jgi:hypothetical protein
LPWTRAASFPDAYEANVIKLEVAHPRASVELHF